MSQKEPGSRGRVSRVLALLALGAAAAVIAISLVQGPPSALPAIALGWPALLYLERAALVAGVIIGIGGIADRLLRGDTVQGFTAPGGPGVQIAERAADADIAIRTAVDAGFEDVDKRLRRLEGRD